jgi:hypothetical protein
MDNNKMVIDLTEVTREDVDAVLFAYVETLHGHDKALDYDFSDLNNELDYLEGMGN